jgi:hypothetical protein
METLSYYGPIKNIACGVSFFTLDARKFTLISTMWWGKNIYKFVLVVLCRCKMYFRLRKYQTRWETENGDRATCNYLYLKIQKSYLKFKKIWNKILDVANDEIYKRTKSELKFFVF